jgi:hypothetical protein
LFYNRPHPGPLLQAEGESFAASLKFARLDLPDCHPQNQKRADNFPSLGGEGQDDGGRKTQILPNRPFKNDFKNPCFIRG